MFDLSNDERTVLMICAKGEAIAAIGRWEQPVNHLVELGYLERGDKFNNFITEAGRTASKQSEDAADDDLAKTIISRHNAGVSYRKSGEEITHKLVELTREAAKATGDEPLVALQKCVTAIRDRAIEILDNDERS